MKCSKCHSNIYIVREGRDIVKLRCSKCGELSYGKTKSKEIGQDLKLKEIK